MTVMQTIWIALAGIFGVLGRYIAAQGLTRALGSAFPFSTMAINVAGSFLIGVVYVLGAERGLLSDLSARALMVGFLGGFTTFSAFSLETLRMIEGGAIGLAALNAAGSVTLCVGATAAGFWIARIS